VGVDGITVSGSHAYIANQNNGTVSVCSIGANGGLSGCAAYPLGTQPTDVVVSGSRAYIDDASGYIYLCAVGVAGDLTTCTTNVGITFSFGIQIAIH
jgi:hypothetical protein